MSGKRRYRVFKATDLPGLWGVEERLSGPEAQWEVIDSGLTWGEAMTRLGEYFVTQAMIAKAQWTWEAPAHV